MPRLTRRDVFMDVLVNALGMKALGIEIKAAPCGCEACASAPPQPDAAAIAGEVAKFVETSARIADPWTPAREAELRRELAHFNATYGLTKGITVHPTKLASARELIAWAAHRWGIVPPAVKFVTAADMPTADWSGWAGGGDPTTVHLRSDLEGLDLVTICLHETSHVGRYLRGLPNTEPEVREDTRHLLAAYGRGE